MNPNKVFLAAAMLAVCIASSNGSERTAVTPTAVTVIENGPFALGWAFTVEEDISVTSLGAFDVAGDGYPGGQQVRLYNSTSDSILATTTIDSAATLEDVGGYGVYYQNISPVTLTTGNEYIVACSNGTTGDIMNSTNLLHGSAIDPVIGKATLFDPNLPDSVADFAINSNGSRDLYMGAQLKYEPAVPKPQKVWLMAGQSNMIGYGTDTADLPVHLQFPQTDVEIYTSTATGWGKLAPGLGPDSGSFGPELTFGQELATVSTDDDVLLVKARFGLGDLYNDWRSPNTGRGPAGSHYTDFVSMAQTALASVPNAELAGMIWMQGEGDASDNITEATSYESNLRLFIESIRSDFNAPDLNFVIGQINESTQWVYGDIVRAAQAEVAATTDNCEMVVTSDLPLVDGMHYTSEGSMELGGRFAQQAANMTVLSGGEEMVAATPTATTIINNGPFALGWSFTVNESISITSLGAFDVAGDGYPEGQQVRLYDSTNDTVLVTTTIDSAAALEEVGDYDVYFQDISPVELTPGIEYLVASSDGTNNDIMNSTSLIHGPAIDPVIGRATLFDPDLPASVTGFTIESSGPEDLYMAAMFKYTTAASLPGDANRDGIVDVSDLGILATNYDAGGGFDWSQGDFTGDGFVDVSDLGILATNYGATSSASAVPEPAVPYMLLMGLLYLASFARRRTAR